jgi:hypothetical protein
MEKKNNHVGVACASIDSSSISVADNSDYEVVPLMDNGSIGSDSKPAAINKAVHLDVKQSVLDNSSLVTPAMDCPTEVKTSNDDNNSGRISSFTCLVKDNDSRSEPFEMGMIPYQGVPDSSNAVVTPHYNYVGHPLYHSTLSNHV